MKAVSLETHRKGSMQQLNLEILMAILSITNNTLLISLITIFSQ